MIRGLALWILPALIGSLQACESTSNPDISGLPPENPAGDSRWVRIHASSPDTVPYAFSSMITVRGEGFDGIKTVAFVYDDGIRFGRIERLTSTTVEIRTPESSPRWSTATLILSETPERMAPEPWQQSDTLAQATSFVGPVPGDTLIYEFRFPSLDGGRVVRWDLSDFPLKVWFSPQIPDRVHESLWFGITAWEDLISPGEPSFTRVKSADDADVRWTTSSSACGTSWGDDDGRLRAQFACPVEKYETLPLDILTNVAAHDNGHVLGLHEHSYRRSDIMGPSLDFLDQGFSEADARTLRALYNMPVSNPTFP